MDAQNSNIKEEKKMKKPWYKSMTFYGSILIAVEAGLLTMPGSFPGYEAAIAILGVFLTSFGIRRAINEK